MKKILLFLTVFIFIYPIFPKGAPIPTDRVLQLLGFGLLIFHPADLKKIIKSKYTIRFCAVSLVLLCLALLAALQNTGGLDTYFIIEVFNVFLYFFSSYFVFWVTRWTYGQPSIGIILEYIVLAAVAQVFISAYFFVHPNAYISYTSFLNMDIRNKDMSETMAMLKKRFLGVGSAVFSGVIKYGIAFFSILILPYFHKSKLTTNKFYYIIAIILVFLGGLLTSRSFFIAIAIGILMLTLFKSKSVIGFIKNNVNLFLIIILGVPVIYFIMTLFLEPQRFKRVFDFVFEAFINLFSGNGLTSSSTERLGQMYVFPNNFSTWMFGDGKMQGVKWNYYMHTDVGYLRLIFYFGFPSTLFFVYAIWKYKKILYNVSYINVLNYFFGALFFWVIILNFKGLAFPIHYFVLFLLFLIFSQKKKQISL